MPKLNWDSVGQRYFETGVEKAVLYVDGHDGVPWNGLVSVAEKTVGGDPKPFYLDGVKYLNVLNRTEFAASIEAFTYPDEFEECEGIVEDGNLWATNQIRKPFGLCYRTRIGNDTEGVDHGYKLHIIYGALASPSDKAYVTLSDEIEPSSFTWDISTTPPRGSGSTHHPTAHFIVDSRTADPLFLGYLEAILYGAEGYTSRLPNYTDLRTYLNPTEPSGLSYPVNVIGQASDAGQLITNESSNPSFETGDGSVSTMATNLFTNPSFEADLSGISSANLTNIRTSSSAMVASGTWASHHTVNASPNQYTYVAQYATGITAGNQFAFSVNSRWSSGSRYARLRIIFRDSANADKGGITGDTIELQWAASGGGNRYTLGGTIPTGADRALCLLYLYDDSGGVAAPLETSAFTTDAWCAVTGSDLAFCQGQSFDFFDGNTAAGTDYRYNWVGTANSSTSRRLIDGTKLMSSGSATTAQVYRSSDDPLFGSYVNRSRITVGTGSAYFSTQYYRDYDLNSSSAETYKWGVWIRSSITRSIGITTTCRSGATSVYSVAHDAKTCLAGQWVYFTQEDPIPSGHDYLQLWLRAGTVAYDATIDMDGLVITKGGSPLPPYFDGSTPIVYDKQMVNPVWALYSHDSTSSFTDYDALSYDANVGDAYIIPTTVSGVDRELMWVYTDNGYWEYFGYTPNSAG